MAEEHKKSFMLYFDNFPCVAALDAEQRGELLLLLYRYAMAADKAPTDPEDGFAAAPGLEGGDPHGLPVSGGDHSAGYREVEGKAAALPRARRRGGRGIGAISRQALEQAAPKDYSDIRKYLRGRLYRWSVAKIGPDRVD